MVLKRLSRAAVLKAENEKEVRTKTGLKKSQLMKNKRGKVVTKRQNSAGKKNLWAQAVKQAREDLKLKEFQPLTKDSELYKQAQKNHLAAKAATN